MRLHVSYNAFNGLEFLEPNIRNMRAVASRITVVWQELSNYGNPAKEDIARVIARLKHLGLIDHDIKYQPDRNLGGPWNELNKRNLGLAAARYFNCTHHLDMDVDEFYFQEQLRRAMVVVEAMDLDATYCRIVEYHKTIRHRCKEMRQELHAPFIMKAGGRMIMGAQVPVLLDPKRRVQPNKRNHVFPPEELLMHHYSLVRKDYSGKFKDANNRRNNVKRMQAVRRFDKRKYKLVDNYFKI